MMQERKARRKKAEEIEQLVRKKVPWLAKALAGMVTLVGKGVGLACFLWKKLTKR